MRSALAVPLVLVTLLLAGCTAPSEGGDHTVKGLSHRGTARLAPDFTVTTIDNATLNLSDLRGKVVLLEFMGMSCEGCKANLPAHKELYAAFADDERFAFVALNAWTLWCGTGCPIPETNERMRQYVAEEGIGWIMAPSPLDTVDDYDVSGTPAQFFIDQEGREHSFGRRLSFESMHAEVSYLLERMDDDVAHT